MNKLIKQELEATARTCLKCLAVALLAYVGKELVVMWAGG